MKPRKKKKRQFRQAFAGTLQRLARNRSGKENFKGPLGSIAILAQEKLGDCVLLTPLIRNLRRAKPELEIHLITFSRASTAFFERDPDITAVHHAKRNIGAYRKEVLAREFDLLFNTKDHPSTHFLLQSVLIKARFKVGHASTYHEGLFDRLLTLDYHTHMALKNCALLPLLGIEASQEECRPQLAPLMIPAELQLFLRQIAEKRPTGINISAGEANRTWPASKWKELLQRFPGKQFVVLSGPDERDMKREIERSSHNTITSPATKNLYEAFRIVEKLELLITPDTSLIHIASAAKTPVVGLYREAPQDISRYGPYRIPNQIVVSTTGEVAGIDPDEVCKALDAL